MPNESNALVNLESQLVALTRRVEEMIRVCDNLRGENAILRAHQAAWLRERTELLDKQSKLLEKQQQARTRVEALIARLHEMEQPQ